jgi:hypothetical protein
MLFSASVIFSPNLDRSLADTIAQDQVKRHPCWTESLAVGSNSFVEQIQPLIMSRRETEIVETDWKLWVSRERPVPYGQETGVESACKAAE